MWVFRAPYDLLRRYNTFIFIPMEGSSSSLITRPSSVNQAGWCWQYVQLQRWTVAF